MLGVSFNAENRLSISRILGGFGGGGGGGGGGVFLSWNFKYKYAFIGMCLFIYGEVTCLLSDFQKGSQFPKFKDHWKKKRIKMMY